ncbi:MAG TPA: ammonia channel protein, partial [Burkholderiales bacterium]
GAGLPEGRSMGSQVLIQLGGVLATALWCGVGTWILLKLTQALAGLRVSSDGESEGLDTHLHNEKGYNL